MPKKNPTPRKATVPSSSWESIAAKAELSQAALARSEILNLIISGGISAGDSLQERRLADWLQMSRTPVREALGRLEAEGVVERRGKVLVARQITVQEVKEILAVRERLESYAAQQAAGRVDIDAIETLSKRIDALRKAPDLMADEHWKLDDEVHILVSRGSGNKILMRLISDLRLRTRMFDLDRVPERLGPGCDEHLAILKALADGDAEAASLAMTDHIRNARQGIFDKLLKT